MRVSLSTLLLIAKRCPLAMSAVRSYTRMCVKGPQTHRVHIYATDNAYYTVLEKR